MRRGNLAIIKEWQAQALDDLEVEDCSPEMQQGKFQENPDRPGRHKRRCEPAAANEKLITKDFRLGR